MNSEQTTLSCITIAVGIAFTYLAYSQYELAQNINSLSKEVIDINNLTKNISRSTEKAQRLNEKIELASNERLAMYIANYINQGMKISDLVESDFIKLSAEAFKNDYIDDKMYSKFAKFNIHNEYQQLSKSKVLIREKWIAHIEPESHFDKHKQARLILPNESIDIPKCDKTSSPYVAYALAYPVAQPSLEAEISMNETNYLYPQYQFQLYLNNSRAQFDTKHRVLVDVGCAKDTQTKLKEPQ